MKLDERMKNYVNAGQHHLTSKVPVIINIKGRSFYKIFTDIIKVKKDITPEEVKKLYNNYLYILRYSTISVIKETEGFKIAHVSENEVNILLSDIDTHNVNMQSWYNYNVAKIISMVSGKFNTTFNKSQPFEQMLEDYIFQVKCFNIPDIEVSNYFLWRIKDTRRNSLQDYCRQIFPLEEIHGKKTKELIRMLFKRDLDWNIDVKEDMKNGVFMEQNKNGEIDTYPINHTVTSKDIVYKDINFIIDQLI